ncbi:Uncharacterized protein C1orf167 [Vulpes lagopus]
MVSCISDRALRQLQHMLSGGHLTAQGLSASAPELLGSLPGGEPWLGGRPLRSSPQQRQQFLHGKYQRWVQVHRQGLRRSVFQRWRRAAARRRRPGAPPEQLLLHSHSLAWCAVVRDAGALPTTGAFRGGPGEARGEAWAVWQGARAAEAWARERRVAWASVGRWRKRVQERRADRQLRRARAQQAFAAWRAALGQCCRVRQLVEESRPVPGTEGAGVLPAPGQPSPGRPEAERQG